MSLKLQMLQVATLAPRTLGESTDLVCEFIHSQRLQNGAFKNRAGAGDLYYTLFGIECMRALKVDIDANQISEYCASFEKPENLDLIHLCCLIRTWSNVDHHFMSSPLRSKILKCIDTYTTEDGGYSIHKNSKIGSAYAAFMVIDAMQSLQVDPKEYHHLIQSIHNALCENGGYALQKDMPMPTTPTTAASLVTLKYFNQSIHSKSIDWLKSMAHPQGGFRAGDGVIVPDLLSTATALHTLSALQVDYEDLKEPCLDFIDSLWTNKGGFYGTWEDEYLDVEYLFYALLALGHLSV
jgi:hypothetical protein